MANPESGRDLRNERGKLEFSQEEVAREMGVSVKTVQRLEKSEDPRYRDVAAYLGALEVLARMRGCPDNVVPRGTLAAGPELGQRVLAGITAFEREAARLGATDPELDHIAWALRNPESSRLFYLGDDGKPRSGEEQEEELGYQIDGLRVWLERRIAKRKAAIRGQTTIVEEASEPTTPSSAVERAGRARVAGASRKDR
jgi:transcriptional regulator with XRE-family HTH domain